MNRYKSIKCDNQQQFDYLQNHFLNKGYRWLDSDTNSVIYDSSTMKAILIDDENKQLGLWNRIDRFDRNGLIIEKAVDYNFFMRPFKINKIND